MRSGDETVRGIQADWRGEGCVCVSDGKSLMCDVPLSLGETKERITRWDPSGSWLRVAWIGRKVTTSFGAEKEMAIQLLRFLIITWISILKFCLMQKSGFGQRGFLSGEEFLPLGIPTSASCLDDDSSYGRKMPGRDCPPSVLDFLSLRCWTCSRMRVKKQWESCLLLVGRGWKEKSPPAEKRYLVKETDWWTMCYCGCETWALETKLSIVSMWGGSPRLLSLPEIPALETEPLDL